MSSVRSVKRREESVEGRLRPLLRAEISMRQEFTGARKMGGNFSPHWSQISGLDKQIGERSKPWTNSHNLKASW